MIEATSRGVKPAQACEPSIHVLLLSITLHAACCALTCALDTSSLMNINFKEGQTFKQQWRRRNHHKHIIAHTSNQTISHTQCQPIKESRTNQTGCKHTLARLSHLIPHREISHFSRGRKNSESILEKKKSLRRHHDATCGRSAALSEQLTGGPTATNTANRQLGNCLCNITASRLL